MLAWTRTAIALMAFGFAIARFAFMLRAAAENDVTHTAHARESAQLGGMLVALGMGVQIAATLRYRNVRHAVERNDMSTPPATLVYVLGGVAALIGVAMLVVLARSILT